MMPEIAPLLEQVALGAFVVLEEVVVSNLDLFVHGVGIVCSVVASGKCVSPV